MKKLFLKRGFANTPEGQIHYAMIGRGEPVLFLHRTPRSWDEYREVLPLIGEHYLAIAIDTIGYGDSYKPESRVSIEKYAQGIKYFFKAMSIDRASIVGHHTGGVIAAEVAADYPRHINKLILSSTPYVDAEYRKLRKMCLLGKIELKRDGSHLIEFWKRRMPFYPKNRPDILTRLVIDAFRAGRQIEAGHRAISEYKMEERVPLIKAPTLILTGTEDPFSFPKTKVLSNNIKGSKTIIIRGGMVPMVEQMPKKFAKVVMNFLDK